MHTAELTEDAVSPSGGSVVMRRVCPFCLGIDIDELTQIQAPIESLRSVKIDEADALIKEGYEVISTYATTATLAKKKEVK